MPYDSLYPFLLHSLALFHLSSSETDLIFHRGQLFAELLRNWSVLLKNSRHGSHMGYQGDEGKIGLVLVVLVIGMENREMRKRKTSKLGEELRSALWVNAAP